MDPLQRAYEELRYTQTLVTGGRIQTIAVMLTADEIAALLAAPVPTPAAEPDNHHNALTCPYCNPKRLKFAEPLAPVAQTPQEPTAMLQVEPGLLKEMTPTDALNRIAEVLGDLDASLSARVNEAYAIATLFPASAPTAERREPDTRTDEERARAKRTYDAYFD